MSSRARPIWRPSSFALLIPLLTRSTTSDLSSSAMAEMMVTKRRPIGPPVATPSLRLTNSIPRLSNGALASDTLGGTINTQMTYNSRLQPLQMFYGTNTAVAGSLLSNTCPTTVGNIMHRVYGFAAGTSDNGNVLSILNCGD